MIFTMNLPPALHERIREAAFKQKRSMADLVREAVEKYLDKGKGVRK